MLLQVHRLKVLLPAFFATQVMNDRDQSGTNQEIFCCCCWLVGLTSFQFILLTLPFCTSLKFFHSLFVVHLLEKM
jgi:hypothetical protein